MRNGLKSCVLNFVHTVKDGAEFAYLSDNTVDDQNIIPSYRR